jgi:glycosyltransferase involved in cell wall biosynthesis
VLKILLSAYACEPDGGSEASLGWQVANHLSETNLVHVVTRKSNKQKIENYIKQNKSKIIWHYYDLPKWFTFWKKGSRCWQLYYYLWQLGIYFYYQSKLKKNEYDILQHITFANYWLPSLFSLTHSNFVFGPVGGGEFFSLPYLKIFTYKEVIYEVSRWFSRKLVFIDPFFWINIKGSKLILAANIETAHKINVIRKKNVKLMTQVGLTKKEFISLSSIMPASDEVFRIISVGRLISWKGFMLGIYAVSNLLKNNIKKIDYTIIGDGPLYNNYKKLIEDLDCNANIKLLGKLSKQDTLNRITNCDVLLHPSLHDSGSFVTIEAMAAAKPVICLNIGGPGYLVNDERGYSLKPTNPMQTIKEIEKSLIELITKGNLVKQMGMNGQSFVKNNLLWENKIQQFQEYYYELLRNNANRN